MLNKTITYTDYNGEKQTREFLFNMTEAELVEMQLSVNGGMQALIRRIAATKDSVQLIKIFKDIVLKAYGEKSLDGQRFVKTDDIRAAFEQCPAYSVLFMELAGDADKAVAFLNGIMPESMRNGATPEALAEAQNELENTIQPARFGT